LFTGTTSYQKALQGSLVLKSIASERDVERVAAFHGLIHDQGVAGMVRELVLHHPNTRPEHWLYVEDKATGQVVSSLCLIPWAWQYQGVEIKTGEMGIVGTLEAYRHRGLIRALVERFKELLREGGYDLSQIQGIPYFYRQFGYEYAMPLR
jgi:GNAT superfamily N-acetyltransferase